MQETEALDNVIIYISIIIIIILYQPWAVEAHTYSRVLTHSNTLLCKVLVSLHEIIPCT